MWMHEQPDWPHFDWDTKRLNPKLIQLVAHQGFLLGMMSGLGFELNLETHLRALVDDVVKSSAIEGEDINLEETRFSIASRLGRDVEAPVPTAKGIVEITLDAIRESSEPLTQKRLFSWHTDLFPEGYSGLSRIPVGKWRTLENGPMQIVSGPIGRRKIHFEAPHADRLDKEMAEFLDWFNRADNIDPVLRAGIAHLWFVTIHPFEDGNGRIARAISDMALARDNRLHKGFPKYFYSLSAQIQTERTDYYEQLERQSRNTLDITDWLEWFLGCLERAISRAAGEMEHVLLKTQFWNKMNEKSVNKRQQLIINRMFESGFKGYMNTSKYARMAKCSKDTALRDIQELKSWKAFIQNPGGGRSTSYRLPGKDEL